MQDPGSDAIVRHTLRRIARDGRERGRGQVAPIPWRTADRIADRAAMQDDLAGLRDAALILTMSDGLLRVSEASAVEAEHLEAGETTGGAVLTIPASKSDQEGKGDTRYLGAPTYEALQAWLDRASITTGPVFRGLTTVNTVTRKRLSTASIRRIIRARAAAVVGHEAAARISGHSLRVGSARSLAATGASIAELQQAGGWKSPTTPGVYIRHETAEAGPVARRRYQV